MKQKQFKEYGYTVIFASKYPMLKVEEILGGHIEEALAELNGNFTENKKGNRESYFLKMSKKKIRNSIDKIFK